MNPDLRLALAIADVADEITMRHFQSATLAVRTKMDLTPVSEADEAVERAAREILAKERPDDSVVGEEFGTSGTSRRRWLIDPIDATKNYVRGIPVFATLIALVDGEKPLIGVISAPAMTRRWWSSAGEGAFCNGRPIHASRVDTLGDATITYDNATDFDPFGKTDRFLSLVRRCARGRGFGDFWIHMLVAEGAAEIAVEPVVAAWDVAAVQAIVEEAGGRFTDLRGDARFDGGSGLSTNGLLHDAALEYLR